MSPTPAAPSASREPARRRRRDGYVAQTCAPNMRASPKRMRGRRARSAHRRSPRRAPMRFKIDWADYHAAEADASPACACFALTMSPSSSPYIDWTPFFQTWELKGRYPAHPRRRQAAARRRGRSSTTRRRCWRASSTSAGSTPKAVDRLLARQRRRRRHRALHGRVAQRKAGDAATPCASSSRAMTASPIVALADFVAPHESGKADYIGAFVVTAGPRRTRSRTRFAARQ